ncbi:MAG: LysM peptidoglycan-binding domain-containing protein [Bacilli bacterium]|nr:LysM peptidoglycan-binding domain-containing protein [Bacilli bacterium]
MNNFYDYDEENLNFEEYVVQKGDSLYTIAKKFEVTLNDITEANGLVNNMIYPNQILLIPKKNYNPSCDEYVTRVNDTVEVIAKNLGVTPMELGEYNDFGKLYLTAGQKITIPRNNKVYRISQNDTLESILKLSNRSLSELLELNKDAILEVGKIINI